MTTIDTSAAAHEHCAPDAKALGATPIAATMLRARCPTGSARTARSHAASRSPTSTRRWPSSTRWPAIAHREDHHPDLDVGYDHCAVAWSTHSAGGLTRNDFICAAQRRGLLARRLERTSRRASVDRRAPPALPRAPRRRLRRRLRAEGPQQQIACGDRVRVSVVAGGGVIDAVLPRTTLFHRSDAFRDKAHRRQRHAGGRRRRAGHRRRRIPAQPLDHRRRGAGLPLRAGREQARPAAFRRACARGSAFYETLGYPVVDDLRARNRSPRWLPHLAGQHSVLIGQSGMGKSTIVNALAPDAAARVGDVSAALRRASTRRPRRRSIACRQLDDGWIVDSPGVKAFGLAQVEPDALAHAFVEMRP